MPTINHWIFSPYSALWKASQNTVLKKNIVKYITSTNMALTWPSFHWSFPRWCECHCLESPPTGRSARRWSSGWESPEQISRLCSSTFQIDLNLTWKPLFLSCLSRSLWAWIDNSDWSWLAWPPMLMLMPMMLCWCDVLWLHCSWLNTKYMCLLWNWIFIV